MSPSGKLITGYGLWNMPKGQVLLNELWQQRRCYTPFSSEGHSCKVLLKRGMCVSGCFYKNVVLKKLRTKIRKVRTKTGLQHVHLLHYNASSHKSPTVAQFLKSEKVSVLSHPPYSPDLAPCDFFPFPKLKKSKASRKHTYIILTQLKKTLLYSKTGVYRGIHYFSYFCSKT